MGQIWAVRDKVEALAQATLPTTHQELQNFLGLASYYQHFVPWVATLAAPLTDLLNGGGRGKTSALESNHPCSVPGA